MDYFDKFNIVCDNCGSVSVNVHLTSSQNFAVIKIECDECGNEESKDNG